MDKKAETIYRIREFNRFYIDCLNILDRSYLNSKYSVTEARVLFELKENSGCSAKFLTERLNIDKSYMSRIVKKFCEQDLLTKYISEDDSRLFKLQLTDKGIRVTNDLIEKSNKDIGGLLKKLTESECEEICSSMDIIRKHLSKK
jgi:DNA-binding MarR family transcriptional regulator